MYGYKNEIRKLSDSSSVHFTIKCISLRVEF